MKKEEEIDKNSKNITKTETEKPPLNIDGWYMVFNATFNNMSVISCQSVSFPILLVDETRVHGEKHRPVASHWKFYNIRYRVHVAMRRIQTHNVSGDRQCRLSACWAVAMGS
jgi:hypothetical protein